MVFAFYEVHDAKTDIDYGWMFVAERMDELDAFYDKFDKGKSLKKVEIIEKKLSNKRIVSSLNLDLTLKEFCFDISGDADFDDYNSFVSADFVFDDYLKQAVYINQSVPIVINEKGWFPLLEESKIEINNVCFSNTWPYEKTNKVKHFVKLGEKIERKNI